MRQALYRMFVISGSHIRHILLYWTHAMDIFILHRTHYIRHIYVVSDIFMFYRTYLCFRTHIWHIYVLSDTLYLIYLLYQTYSYYDGPIFYRTCLCYIGHICFVRDTYYIGHICYIGHTFYRTYLFFIGHIYWTHISDMFILHPTPLSGIFMCCKWLNEILYWII